MVVRMRFLYAFINIATVGTYETVRLDVLSLLFLDRVFQALLALRNILIER
jgi:hypothetical protein